MAWRNKREEIVLIHFGHRMKRKLVSFICRCLQERFLCIALIGTTEACIDERKKKPICFKISNESPKLEEGYLVPNKWLLQQHHHHARMLRLWHRCIHPWTVVSFFNFLLQFNGWKWKKGHKKKKQTLVNCRQKKKKKNKRNILNVLRNLDAFSFVHRNNALFVSFVCITLKP